MRKMSRYIALNPRIFGVVCDVYAELNGINRSSAVRLIGQNVELFFNLGVVKLEKEAVILERA